MVDPKDAQSIDAAKLYYLAGLSQAEVAARLGVSRPTASKLLQHARLRGFVTISLNDPRELSDELVSQLSSRFALADARVVSPPAGANILGDLGAAGAALLEELIMDNTIVGVSWGETMASVAEHLRHTPRVGVKVVQLKGGHSHSERSTKDMETLTGFTRAFDAEMNLLPLPVIFDNAETKEFVCQDRHISRMLALGASVDVAVFTVGAATPESLALNLGYLTHEEAKDLTEHAVGDACSRFFTASGEVASPAVDARTVGITLEDLRARPTRVLVAGGAAKADAIRTALTMQLATHLVIDHDTAVRVLSDEPR